MKQGLVITSISEPNEVLKKYAHDCNEKGIDFYLIGDTKSPKDFYLPGCEYWSIERQQHLPFTLNKMLPIKNYARKNLGYLLAMQAGCELIYETDDDNYPIDAFYHHKKLSHDVFVLKNQGWVNIYKYFSNANIWPRGYPLRYIKSPTVPLNLLSKEHVICPIQQGLADDNPDVDAIYRLVNPLPIKFDGKEEVALSAYSWCPFNTQNTTFFKVAFPLMYLPSTCNFRQTDIWRSFIAQRIFWENNWSILFTPPTVFQDRNEHDLLVDFSDEIEGYLHNEHLCHLLSELDIKSGEQFIQQNMLNCYQKLVEVNLLKPEELALLDAWFDDLSQLQLAKEEVPFQDSGYASSM